MPFNRQLVFRWFLLLASAFGCVVIFLPFTIEILSAIFFAFALAPLTQSLGTTKYFHHRGWVALTLFGFILAVTAPLILLGYSFFKLFNELTSEGFQQSALYQDLVQSKNFAIESLRDLLETFNIPLPENLPEFLNQFLSAVGSKIFQVSGEIAGRLPEYALSLFIFCCALYLFLAEGRRIRLILMRNNLIPPAEIDRLIPIFQKSCYVTLLASLIVGFVQAGIVAVGSRILGSEHMLIIFLITFICSFIPVLGAAPIALALGLFALIKGTPGLAIGYLIVAVLAGASDNILRPILVRGEDNIHPVVMLLAIIGAILLMGIPGLFLGPMFVIAVKEIFNLYIFEDPPDSKNLT
jgi:predicted PurR-regulated permease PerM